jgi:N-glycosylase/DNA lyase
MTAVALGRNSACLSEADVVSLVVPGWTRVLKWGPDWHIGSPAYWVAQVDTASRHRHALGRTLREEVAACLLGGHGMPAAVGLAAYRRIREAGLLDEDSRPSSQEVFSVLSEPMEVRPGHRVRYRFAAQRSERLAGALGGLSRIAYRGPLEMRDALTGLPGVGLKTASWIVRNRTDCDQVAILDVHIQRAGVIAGVFESSWTPARDYRLMERLFVAWAQAGNVRTGDLDAAIWRSLAGLGRNYDRILGHIPGREGRFLLASTTSILDSQ